ncbi:BAP31 protein, partial [Paradoxornis webbianus]|nr:BAP31 protein [Sinosuthora webbiana]
RWQKIFRSRLVGLAVAYGNTFFIVLIVILVLLLLGGHQQAPGVSGGALCDPGGLWGIQDDFGVSLNPISVPPSLLRRLVTLISAQAALGASSQAFRKQAEGASQAARQYLEDNDALRKVQ